MAKEYRLQTIEIYDAFRPNILLDVKFALAALSEEPVVITYKSPYYSIRQLFDGDLTPKYEQMELDFRNGHKILKLTDGAQLQ